MLALDDLMEPNAILRIEWGEKFERFRKERDVEVVIEQMGGDDRVIHVAHKNR